MMTQIIAMVLALGTALALTFGTWAVAKKYIEAEA